MSGRTTATVLGCLAGLAGLSGCACHDCGYVASLPPGPRPCNTCDAGTVLPPRFTPAPVPAPPGPAAPFPAAPLPATPPAPVPPGPAAPPQDTPAAPTPPLPQGPTAPAQDTPSVTVPPGPAPAPPSGPGVRLEPPEPVNPEA